MLDTIRITYLAEVPECVPAVARWLFDEFHDLIPGHTVEQVAGSLRERMNFLSVPTCIVAHYNDEVIGTVSLKLHDLDARKDLSPWLAGLYVADNFRKNGVGSFLVKTIEDMAVRMNINKLFLYTPDAAGFYDRLGWMQREELTYNSIQVTVLEKDLRP